VYYFSFTNICIKALIVYFIFQYDIKEDIIMWACHSLVIIAYHEISEINFIITWAQSLIMS